MASRPRLEVLDRWRHDLERTGEDGYRAEYRDAIHEHPGFPRGASLRQAGDAPPAIRRLRADWARR